MDYGILNLTLRKIKSGADADMTLPDTALKMVRLVARMNETPQSGAGIRKSDRKFIKFPSEKFSVELAELLFDEIYIRSHKLRDWNGVYEIVLKLGWAESQ